MRVMVGGSSGKKDIRKLWGPGNAQTTTAEEHFFGAYGISRRCPSGDQKPPDTDFHEGGFMYWARAHHHNTPSRIVQARRKDGMYLDEGKLLPHALVHSRAEAHKGEGLLVLLSSRSEAVRVELKRILSRLHVKRYE